MVVTLDELARAAGVTRPDVNTLVARGLLPLVDDQFVAWPEAVAAGRRLRDGQPPQLYTFAETPVTDGADHQEGAALVPVLGLGRRAAMPAAVSSAAHGGVLALALIISSLGVATSETTAARHLNEPMRLVYLTTPGLGGGGGGGGLRHRTPPQKAELKGDDHLSSPVVAQETPKPAPPEPAKQPEPKVEEPKPVVAPIAERAADQRDKVGVLENAPAQSDSHGSGVGGGAGTGAGTGIGGGQGSGIGPGSGGGTGGGPYRPGSGIEPPRLLREVKPSYTDEARRQNIAGEVVLEIVVGENGSVRDVRIVRALGYGLDERAIAAVRQWRFAPARRLGAPVSVMVEVAVEFALR